MRIISTNVSPGLMHNAAGDSWFECRQIIGRSWIRENWSAARAISRLPSSSFDRILWTSDAGDELPHAHALGDR
jgi:hypothetical protein